MTAPASATWRSWAGLAAGPAAWGLHHQVGSNLNYANCSVGDGLVVVLTGLAALALALAGGWISWTAWRGAGGRFRDNQEPAPRFVAVLSLMAAALFALTIAVQIGAGLVLPSCWR